MAPPSDLRVGVNALRSDAKIWDTHGDAIGTAAGNAGGLEMDLDVAGMLGKYSGLIRRYEQARSNLITRFSEGSRYFDSIAETLMMVAAYYAKQEAETASTFNQHIPD